jgi:hypothetical protein
VILKFLDNSTTQKSVLGFGAGTERSQVKSKGRGNREPFLFSVYFVKSPGKIFLRVVASFSVKHRVPVDSLLLARTEALAASRGIGENCASGGAPAGCRPSVRGLRLPATASAASATTAGGTAVAGA